MDTHAPGPVDRVVDFDRTRWLKCPGCSHSWEAGWDFIEKWDGCQTGCPGCGILADDNLVDRPPYHAAPDEAMVDEALVRKSSWFHTSFHVDWPRANYNPLDDLSTEKSVQARESPDVRTTEWLSRQQNKALHVGTYEAAVANLYRRLTCQPSSRDLNFHVYRLQLSDTAVVRPGIFSEMANFSGDVDVNKACPWPSEVTRYANIREDEGSVSLAVRRSAILRTQSVRILDLPVDLVEVETITRRIERADALPPPPPRKNILGRVTAPQLNRVAEGSRIAARMSADIPWRIRDHFNSRGVTEKLEGSIDPETWARWVLAVRELAINPTGVMEILKAQPWVTVEHSERLGDGGVFHW